ncbi:MAG: PKD domain-containing protein [Crocinitomicaceae bacterium]
MKLIITLIMLATAFGYSQEICDNGFDDDDDGLIDLQDPECHCGAGIIEIELPTVIPNPNFDLYSCCPATAPISITCLNNWENSNSIWNIYAEYVNSCNSCDNGSPNWDPIADIPNECFNPTPDGLLSLAYYGNTNEYIYNDFASVCLNAPLSPGFKYRVQFNAFRPYIFPKPGFNNINKGVVETGIFGTTDCNNVPMLNSGCPTNPFWTPLDDIYDSIPMDSEWHQYNYYFEPSSAITSFGFGPTCGAGSHIVDNKNTVHFFMDSVRLFYAPIFTITITETGSFCNENLMLSASIDSNFNGTWQWYKDSVAIVGETIDSIDITNLGPGNYTALYLLNDNCQGKTMNIPDSEFPLTSLGAPFEDCQNTEYLYNGESVLDPTSLNYITNFKWNFGNGQIAYSEDTLYAFPSAGTYDIELVAFTNKGCTDTANHSIIINPTPNISFISENNCLYDSIGFTNTSSIISGNITDIIWDFGNNLTSQNSTEKIKFTSPGDHPIELKALTNLGCTDSLEQVLFVNAVPISKFTANDTCIGLPVSFNNQSSILLGDISNYLWDFGNTITSSANSPITSFDSNASYSVELITISDSGCTDTSNLSINIYPNPTASFSQLTSCLETTFNNTSSVSPGTIVSSNWNFGDNMTSNTISPTHKYDISGNYLTNLSVVSNYGCIHDTSLMISPSSKIDISFSTSATSICSNDCIDLNFEAIPNIKNAKYYWKFSNGQESFEPYPNICLTNDNNYTNNVDVSLYINNISGCDDTLIAKNYIQVRPTPKAEFTFSPKEVTLSEPTVYFQNHSVNAVHNEWNFGDNSQSEQLNPIHTYPNKAALYGTTLTVFDSSKTCKDQYRLNIKMIDEIVLYIPNAFTPLTAGNNDIFLPVITSGVNIYKYKLEIFNRWGELLFISYNPEIGWDGRYNGEPLKPGAYIWKIDFIETMSDKAHELNGTVILVN